MLLTAQEVSKTYLRKSKLSNYFFAVNPTSFVLEEKALTVLVGRSGSGKTTFLNILAGLLEPSSGKILMDGTDLYGMDDKTRSLFRNQHIGVVPQGQSALHSLSVLENVILPSVLYDSDSQAELRAMRLLERFGIGHLRDVPPSALSGGELRRMAIARALIQAPSVLLADEPTGDLDDENTALVLNFFREIADEGTAVLVVTHETEALRYADAAYRMDSGDLTRITL